MSYTISVSGHADSKKAEAEVLKAAADMAEAVEANGTFSFSGGHFSVYAGPVQDGVAKARAALEQYAATADADDQVN